VGDFTLTVPITQPSKAKYTVDKLLIDRVGPRVAMEVVVQDSGGAADIERVTYNIPDSAHVGAPVAGFLGALLSPRASETGSNARKANFRALGYLLDQGYLPAGTLNP